VLVNLVACDSHDLSKNGAVSSAFLEAAGMQLQQVDFCSLFLFLYFFCQAVYKNGNFRYRNQCCIFFSDLPDHAFYLLCFTFRSFQVVIFQSDLAKT